MRPPGAGWMLNGRCTLGCNHGGRSSLDVLPKQGVGTASGSGWGLLPRARGAKPRQGDAGAAADHDSAQRPQQA